MEDGLMMVLLAFALFRTSLNKGCLEDLFLFYSGSFFDVNQRDYHLRIIYSHQGK